MNPVLQYAIDHQTKARQALIAWGVPLDDIEDVYQCGLVKLLTVNPPNAKGPATYWKKTLHTTAIDYCRVRRYQRLPVAPMEHIEDPAQDPERQAEVREALRQAGAIISAATPKERDAVAAKVRGEPMSNARNQRLHHLRRRLREAVPNG